MSIEKILIIDDELLIRNFLAETLRRKSFEVTTAPDGKSGIKILKEKSFDLVITDMKMPDITGLEVLRQVKEIAPETMVIIITAFGSIENAVEAMRIGAYNYLIKPFSPDTIEAVIAKAQEYMKLVEENRFLRKEVSKSRLKGQKQVIAESKVMKRILSDLKRVSMSPASVLILGESGTGKEVVASYIHYNSYRRENSFVRVNCAAIPDTLVESEFFGHEKGAFTGANNKRLGRFEMANQGTLLLDEVTEIPFNLQAKLLRAIQEQEFERVGGSKSIQVDLRIVSTSNRNMREAIEDRVFREDLYYRLNVVPIHLPALRERREDILPLANFFLEQAMVENHKNGKRFSLDAQKALLGYSWPGNIRELANIIERSVVMDFSDLIEKEHLYLEREELFSEDFEEEEEEEESILMKAGPLPIGISLHELERRMILETLKDQEQNRTRTAKILGISIRTLRNKLNEYEVINPYK